ncbi:hypothetical protein ACJJIL_17860 [Microbulbifer sp. EKSA005]|uniref:hypothetical protein n=1 Tax=Microbulbifer sp. EKSA005 TaxID=3243364 RepID=UPI0040424753
MKIISGSFGVEGSAYISRDNYLVVEGASKVIYSPDKIKSVSSQKVKEKKFSLFRFLLAAAVLCIILWVFLGFIGLLVFTSFFGIAIAVVLACLVSFYSVSKNNVEVKFLDEKSVVLECSPGGVKKLTQFAG